MTSSCCSSEMESALSAWTVAQMDNQMEVRATQTIEKPFRDKARKIDHFMSDLVGDARKQLHAIFTRTYGVLYERNSKLFNDLFDAITDFYNESNEDNIESAVLAFFRELYVRMFSVMNAQYTFDAAYLSCVSNSMEQEQPFGSTPNTIAQKLHASLAAVKALSLGLNTAAEAGHTLKLEQKKLLQSDNYCGNAIRKMHVCPTCGHYYDRPESVAPCNNLCLNVVKGCLAFHEDLQRQLDALTDALKTTLDRLLGPLNVEKVVLPLDIHISDAIMHYQESGFQITQNVFKQCGTPKIMKRAAIDETQSRRSAEVRSNSNWKGAAGGQSRSELDRIATQIGDVIKQSQRFYNRLPFDLCPSSSSNSCWNGTHIDSYKYVLVEDGLAQQMLNPEVAVQLNSAPSALTEQTFRLKSAIRQLELINEGKIDEIQWWDTSAETPRASQHKATRRNKGSAENKRNEGSAEYSGDDEYEEEDYYSGSGSNDDCDDEDGCRSWHESGRLPSSTTEKSDIIIIEEADPSLNEIDTSKAHYSKASLLVVLVIAIVNAMS